MYIWPNDYIVKYESGSRTCFEQYFDGLSLIIMPIIVGIGTIIIMYLYARGESLRFGFVAGMAVAQAQ